MRRRRRAFPSFVILIFLCCTVAADAGEFTWRERLDFSILNDSNVFETVSAAESDRAGRLMGHFAGSGLHGDRLAIAMNYDAGLEIYGRHNEENRFVNDLRLRFERGLSSRCSVGLALQGRSKVFFDAARGFSLYRATPHLGWRISKRLHARLFGSIAWLDHARGENFDYRQIALGLSCELHLGERFTSGLRFSIGDLDFGRLAVDYRPSPPDDPPVYPWITLAGDQADSRREAALTVEFYRWLFVQGELGYAVNRSNAWGYAYDQLKARLLLVKTLPWELTLRGYWTLLSKDYAEDLEPVLQVRPDTENEESSHLLVDVTRDLGSRTSLRLRVGRYRNESPFRDRYYEKTVISTGVTRRF